MNQFFVQGVGYLALLFVLFSFQKNTRAKILLIMLVGLLLFVIHYLLLGAWTGAVMNLIEAGVVFVSHKKETSAWATRKMWPYFFVVLYVIAGILTAQSFVDYLPVLAQTFGVIAVWQINPKALRFIMLAPRPLWFAYNFMVGSFAGMTTEIFILISVVTGIIRFDVLGKKNQQPTIIY